MQEGGFTLVEDGAAHLSTKKHKVSDGMSTTMLGISQEESMRIYKEQLKKGMSIIGLNEEEEQAERKRILQDEVDAIGVS